MLIFYGIRAKGGALSYCNYARVSVLRTVRDCVTRLATSSTETSIPSFDVALLLMFCISPVLVDGGWGEWSGWSVCSKSCGGGVTSRFRVCDNPPPNDKGKPCNGTSNEEKSCNRHSCPGEH